MSPTPQQSVFDSSLPWAAWIEANPSPANLDDARKAMDEVVEHAKDQYLGICHEISEREGEIVAAEKEMEELKRQKAEIEKKREELDARYIPKVVRVKELSKGALPIHPSEQTDLQAEMQLLEEEWALWGKKLKTYGPAINKKQREIDALHRDVREMKADLGPIDRAYDPLKARVETLKKFCDTPESDYDMDSTQVHGSPTVLNSLKPAPRYLRILAWNLENFTRDSRPRGSAPVHSLRNQARIALVSNLAFQLGADALLLMETGTDVGTAMTHIADRLQQLQKSGSTDTRVWNPLVSPATHAIPKVKMDYREVKLGRPTGDRILALRALLTSFKIKPRKTDTRVTVKQMEDACRILPQASPEVLEFGVLPVKGDGSLDPEAIVKLGNGNVSPGPGWFFRLFGVSTGFPKAWWNLQKVSDEFRTAGKLSKATLDYLEALVMECREITFPGQSGQLDRELVGFAESVELACLFTLKAHGYMSLHRGHRAIWASFTPEAPSIPLLAAYCTTAQPIGLYAHDRDLGPVASAYDPGLILNAMRRAGILKYNLETYGVVFRSWNESAFFESLLLPQNEQRDVVFAADGAYGILQTDTSGDTLSIQEEGGVLSGRSALAISLPFSDKIRVPVMLLHNRFTGTAAIKEMASPKESLALSNDDKVLRARLLTVLEVAKAAAAKFRPLLIGDFNFPTELVDEQPQPTDTPSLSWRRDKYLRFELSFGMNLHGYLRRSKTAPQSKTSLVSYASIASGKPVYSQPYDAVYQPFDYLDGTAKTMSGVVCQIDALMPASIMANNISATVPDLKLTADVDLFAEDDDEKAEGGGMDDAEIEMEVNADLVTFPLREAIAFETRRVYLSLCKLVPLAIEKCRDWIRREINTGKPDSTDLLMLNDEKALQALILDRANIFYDKIKADLTVVLTTTVDPLDDWISCAERVVTAATLTPPTLMEKLAGNLRDIKAQLTKLETDKAARLWVAYRAIVSDHLPLIVEVDLKPF